MERRQLLKTTTGLIVSGLSGCNLISERSEEGMELGGLHFLIQTRQNTSLMSKLKKTEISSPNQRIL